MSLARRPATLMLLLLFLLGEIWLQENGRVKPVTAPAGGWQELASGSYFAEDGLLVPETGTGPVLRRLANRVAAIQPEETFSVDTLDRLLVFHRPRTAILVQGKNYVVPVSWGRQYLFADALGRNLWLVDPTTKRLQALLPETISGIHRDNLLQQYPNAHLVWAMAPVVFPDGTILYASNRTDPVSDVLSLWQWQQGENLELIDGVPLHSVWPLGTAGNEAYLADGKGDVLLYQEVTRRAVVLLRDVEPIAFQPEGGVLVRGLSQPDAVWVAEGAHTERLRLPAGLALVGLGAFSPNGRRLVLLVHSASGDLPMVWSRRGRGYVPETTPSLPSGWSLDGAAWPSWLDDRTLLVTLRKGAEVATFLWTAGEGR